MLVNKSKSTLRRLYQFHWKQKCCSQSANPWPWWSPPGDMLGSRRSAKTAFDCSTWVSDTMSGTPVNEWRQWNELLVKNIINQLNCFFFREINNSVLQIAYYWISHHLMVFLNDSIPVVIWYSLAIIIIPCHLERKVFKRQSSFGVILPKRPYPPWLRMADRARLAGYPRIQHYVFFSSTWSMKL